MKEIRILLVGGGSGGHAYPLVAVAESLRERARASNLNLKLMMLGSGVFLERAAREHNIQFKKIVAGKLRAYSSFDNIIDLFKVPVGFIQSLWYIFWFMPDLVFSKGGYDSVPPALVAKLYFIPVFIHESDSVPGLANKIISRLSKKVFVSFFTAEKHFESSKVLLTGNPVRKKLMSGDKNSARAYFNFSESRPTLLILGGSQGAKIINDVVISGLVTMTSKFNIIHQCGESQFDSLKKEVETITKEGAQQYVSKIEASYRFYPFLDENEMSLAYAMADIIVSRAGAGHLFEIAQVGKPAIIVPITHSRSNHQYLNAFEFSLSGGYLMEESNFNRDSLVRVADFLLNPETYAKTSEKIKTFATPGAADLIAEQLLM